MSIRSSALQFAEGFPIRFTHRKTAAQVTADLGGGRWGRGLRTAAEV